MEQLIKEAIRNVPDFPKPGIQFKDITPLFLEPRLVNQMLDHYANRYKDLEATAIVGIESRGFLVGPALAAKMGIPFVLVRKKGKLPAKTISHTYSLEYGTDTIEMHEGAIKAGDRVIIHDDLLATGGTAAATAALVQNCGATVAQFSFIVNLSYLNGEERLNKVAPCHSIVTY